MSKPLLLLFVVSISYPALHVVVFVVQLVASLVPTLYWPLSQAEHPASFLSLTLLVPPSSFSPDDGRRAEDS